MRWILFALSSVLALYGVGLANPATSPTIQGDTLGMQAGEGWEGYVGRAEASLSKSSEPAFALIAFTHPLSSEEASRSLAGISRVNGLLLIDAPLHPIPEPTASDTRADVFARETERLAGPGEHRISAVVVFDAGEELRAVAQDTHVAAVEVLPEDAVWGSFAVFPWPRDTPPAGV